MSPAQVHEDDTRGWIVPVGGAEDKLREPTILKRFLALSGEGKARIAVIPTASQLDDTPGRYERIFKDLGAEKCKALPYLERNDTDRDDWHELLEDATGIFFTGGNQLRLSTILGGTRVAKTIRRRNAQGITVGGTSAGAAILPEHMIAYGSVGGTPTAGMVSLAPGLGLTNRFVIDQHFRERDRLGRLLSALSYNPFAVGIGIDENTAAFISPNNVIHVEGAGAITVVDVSSLEHSSIAAANEGEALCLTNVKLHILPQGATFNLQNQEALPPAKNGD
ncbi:MAG: cyanophycinase [Myxococcota bacterium]|jgi:cyanophycinase|nr:cyanophycinase [Myxococcota bacterium]